MNTTNEPAKTNVPSKKEMRKQLADKIAAAVPELQAALGDKKFHHRIKKAVKLITEGIHKKEAAETVKKAKKAKAVKAKAPKKAVAKKAKSAKPESSL